MTDILKLHELTPAMSAKFDRVKVTQVGQAYGCNKAIFNWNRAVKTVLGETSQALVSFGLVWDLISTF